ncbi:hypothetical protein F5B19DRAFT_456211 [Rostrohypoxylon terebratum]|nr:hypothetical protein F5B19DRAFT_456211 [Rostrohypoxylon terebratum]
MKTLTTTLCVLLAVPFGLAAPVVTHDKTPSQSNTASSHVQQATQPAEQHQTKSFLSPFFASNRAPTGKQPKVVISENGQRMQLPDHLAGAKTWETPNVLHFLASLAHPKKLSPFPNSSIMIEETRANNAEIEPQLTIVELETKAERESWTYLPYVAEDNVLHFKCVHKVTDKSLFLIAFPVFLLSITSIILLSALRHLYRRLFPAKYGAIRLDDEENATPGNSLKIANLSGEPPVLKLDSEVDFSDDSTINEKSNEL